ncbi:MAG TPA: hypothetical protein P5282_10325, partial [Anaerolineaceae bacterium]|nr:hypothetical protein [Anaerolineaceae bacterium]
MSESQAAEAAKETFLKNLPLAATDFVEIGAAFLGAKFLPKPLQKSLQKGLESRFGKHVIDPAIKIATPALMEGGEEVLQDVIQRSSLDESNPWAWDEQKKHAFGAGAIMGGVMGGAGVITDLKAVQEQASQEQPTPYTPPPLQKPDTTPVSYSGPVLGNIGGGTPPVVPSPSSKQTAIMPYATREEKYGTLTDKRGLVTGAEGVSGLPAGTTPATPVYHKGNPVQVVSIPNNEYYIVQDAAGKKMAVAQDEVEVRAEVTQPVVQDTVIPTESTPADKTPAVTDDTEQTAAVTAGVASVPQMGDKPVEDETSQGQATQKEPWQMTKPELAQQKSEKNPAPKQELAGEGAKTTGAQPPVPAVAGNKVKQQAVIVRHPDGDGYAVSAGVDRWISGGGGAFGGGSIGKWNTVEGAIKGTSHLNKKDWDIVVSDELKPGA